MSPFFCFYFFIFVVVFLVCLPFSKGTYITYKVCFCQPAMLFFVCVCAFLLFFQEELEYISTFVCVCVTVCVLLLFGGEGNDDIYIYIYMYI